MTRAELLERIIARAAEAEDLLASGRRLTDHERQRAEAAIERALRAITDDSVGTHA
jgi:hypothetical protein